MITHIQKQAIAQKAGTTTASSVLDTSSQSESLQRKADMVSNAAQRAEPPRPNNTGMPDNLKSGIESLSGFSMDDVRVHYNSSKPATVQALAYTQGTDIHVAPGQEKHLPHEAWHVAQQMAGRVSPTTNINGMPVNDNASLEHEADVMGEKAAQQKSLFKDRKNNASIASEIKQLFKLEITDEITIVGKTVRELKDKVGSLCSSKVFPNKEHYSRLYGSLPDKYDNIHLDDSVTSEEMVLNAIALSRNRYYKTNQDNITCRFPTLSNRTTTFCAEPYDRKFNKNTYYSNVNPDKFSLNFLFNSKQDAEIAAFNKAHDYVNAEFSHLVRYSPLFINTPPLHIDVYKDPETNFIYGYGSVLHGPEYIWISLSDKCYYPIHYHPVVLPLRWDGIANYKTDGDYEELEKGGHYLVI